MLKVGLTGGIACGKSTVAALLARRGAYIARADDIARQLMTPGMSVYADVVRAFGRDILNSDGSINRTRLAEAAFTEKGGKSRVDELNRLVHPAVVQRQDEWMAEIASRNPAAITIVEAALIYEAGADTHFDRIVVVTCRPEQKAERFARRQGLTLDAGRAEVARRSRAQWPDEDKARRAHFVIDNSGAESAADAEVERVWRGLERANSST